MNQITDPFVYVFHWIFAPLFQMVNYFETGQLVAGLLMLVLCAIIYAVLVLGVLGLFRLIRARRGRRTTRRRRY